MHTTSHVAATNNPKCKLESTSGGGYSGGGGASTGAAKDAATGARYFYKSTGLWGLDMLMAEYKGIKVGMTLPVPIACGGRACEWEGLRVRVTAQVERIGPIKTDDHIRP